LGVGQLKEQEVIHPKIKHFGFIQPSEMQKYIAETGVFILPSHFEPWGVVVHEFAAAGFPLILSKEVGASEQFLKNDQNGFIFNGGNIVELKAAMQKVMNKKDTELIDMGQKSVELAKSITPEKWAKTLSSVLSPKLSE
ncbi:MAG: glycosyltransferase, partial [Bacteroidota bacterium]|nr:glycosyltransferase [Bacteroidota bacterium]